MAKMRNHLDITLGKTLRLLAASLRVNYGRPESRRINHAGCGPIVIDNRRHLIGGIPIPHQPVHRVICERRTVALRIDLSVQTISVLQRKTASQDDNMGLTLFARRDPVCPPRC